MVLNISRSNYQESSLETSFVESRMRITIDANKSDLAVIEIKLRNNGVDCKVCHKT